MTTSDVLMTIDDAAKCLAMSRGALYRLIWLGEVPAVSTGRRCKLKRSQVEYWVQHGFTTTATRKKKRSQPKDKLKPAK